MDGTRVRKARREMGIESERPRRYAGACFVLWRGDNYVDILRIEDHEPYHGDDDDSVPCARCGKLISATSLRCPECGVHFQGQAQFFVHESERSDDAARANPSWVVIVAIVLLIIFVASALAP